MLKIDVVFIAFKADRLIPQVVNNIKRILSWLNCEKRYLRFTFVGTYAENLSDAKKKNS